MTGLPVGWAQAMIGEVCETSLGKMLDAKQQTGLHPTPYLRNINVRWGSFDLADVAQMDVAPHELDRVLARCGDVIACEGGEPGRAAVWRTSEPIALQKALHRIRPVKGLLPDYVAFFLQYAAASGSLKSMFTGTTIKHLPKEKLQLVLLPIAPIGEQQRILAAIEEAFSKLDAGEAGLHKVRQLLKRMRESILTAAVTGQLNVGCGVRGNESWKRTTIGAIAHVGSGTTPKRGNTAYWEGGSVPWVTSGLVTFGAIRHAQEFVTPLALKATSLRLWPAGTLLVAMYGEGRTRGRCAELGIEATVNQACAAIALRDEFTVYKDFVRIHFDASYSANRGLASGGVQPNLNGGLIKAMPIDLPPPGEAARIVAEVERQFSFVDACERTVDVGLARSAALRRSILKAAFEGKLVPQDASHETASVLLERIRAERAAAPATKRRARKSA